MRHCSPSRRTGRLARPANRSGGGSGWSGVRRCEPTEPDRTGDLLRVIRPGWRAGGDTQVVLGIGIVARPARRRRCGKARTRPPDASFRKTSRAERSAFVETVFLLSSPGEGPGASPSLPLDLPRPRGGARSHDRVIPGKRARRGEADPGKNSAAPKAARGQAHRRFSSQFPPDFLYVDGFGADRIRVLKTVRSRRLDCRFHRPCDRAFHRPNI